MRRVYMDFAAATPLHPAVAAKVRRAEGLYGNPSAPHEEGRMSRAAIEGARIMVARALSVKPDELIFTGGGTEANNLAIRGLIEALRERGARYADLHIITSPIEHSSVQKTCALLERDGVQMSYVKPRRDGVIAPEKVIEVLRPETALVALAHVNSEIGTVQPIAEISASIHGSARSSSLKKFAPEARFPVIHADAAQSPLYLNVSPHALRASLVSYDVQKLMGPKGVGVLYRDFSVPLAPIIGGGGQERGLCPGTENIPAIAGAGVAFRLAKEGRKEREAVVRELRDYLIERVEKEVPEARLIGSRRRRIANNACFAIPGIDGDYLAILMDREGIAVTPRSACLGASAGRSDVVFAVTHDDALSRGTVRFSLGPGLTRRDVDRAIVALVKSLKTTRMG